jgi:catechol-2,3-dioxygenase
VPELQSIDHVHVFTADRGRAEAWYERVLGLTRVKEFEHWATKRGPLFLTNMDRTVSIALFERPWQPTQSTIAFRASGPDFLAWQKRLAEAVGTIDKVDHDGSWSLYFSDLDGNPFEITSYDYEWLKEQS